MATSGLFAPKYYSEFECIKGECRHSCCIGWEIDIDSVTMEKYSRLGGEMGERIRKSISRGEKNDILGVQPESPAPLEKEFGATQPCAEDEVDAVPHFVLVENDRCPHLDECGLCRIITALGDDYLSDICRLHPRFFNETSHGCEVGLGMSCEEACRIILSSDGYADIVIVGESECDPLEFDVKPLRDEVYSILSNRGALYSERLSDIERAFSVSPAMLSDCEWREIIESLEYLDSGSEKRFSHYSSCRCDSAFDLMLERALAYFVYRHASSAKDMLEFQTGLGFALFCERLIASVVCAEKIHTEADFLDLARLVSEEIEYSSDNTDAIRSEFEFKIQ